MSRDPRRAPWPSFRDPPRRSRLSTLFELRGKSWIVALLLNVLLALLGFLLVWKWQH